MDNAVNSESQASLKGIADRVVQLRQDLGYLPESQRAKPAADPTTHELEVLIRETKKLGVSVGSLGDFMLVRSQPSFADLHLLSGQLLMAIKQSSPQILN